MEFSLKGAPVKTLQADHNLGPQFKVTKRPALLIAAHNVCMI